MSGMPISSLQDGGSVVISGAGYALNTGQTDRTQLTDEVIH